MIVLDTDVVSNLMAPRPSPGLVARLQGFPPDQHCTTSVTIGELAYGARRVGRPELYRRALDLLSATTVLSFDRDAAEQYGRIRSELEQQGKRLADPDLRIAATVLAHEATLITGNLRHFARMADLRAENWFEP